VYLLPYNLKRLLEWKKASANDALYMGRWLEGEGADNGLIYMSGGGGYVLSREAVRRLVEEGLESSFCRPADVAYWEDVNIGYCMRFLGIEPMDMRDEEGRETFHYQYPKYLSVEGRSQMVSPFSVSFHYISTPSSMYGLHRTLWLPSNPSHPS